LLCVAAREWPYEHIVPGKPKNNPPYNGGKQRGHKRFAEQAERQQKIDAAMAKMPQMIADFRVRRQVAAAGWLACRTSAAGCVLHISMAAVAAATVHSSSSADYRVRRQTAAAAAVGLAGLRSFAGLLRLQWGLFAGLQDCAAGYV
jgi:hypothetical protein